MAHAAGTESEDADAARARQEARERLRRALAEGPPQVTGDELDAAGHAHSARSDEEYQADRPPHHGG